MQQPKNIQYIQQAAIDREKWDTCISHASNGLIYGYSYYLDHMAKNWDALVMNDYEIVMPLTWNRKFGIHYLYQPFLTAQLGIFGNNLTTEIISSFLHSIPTKYLYWDITLNYQNIFQDQEFNPFIRKNYVLDLAKPYAEIQSNYSENILRNIRKSHLAKCVIVKSIDKQEVIRMALLQINSFTKQSKENIQRFTKLSDYLLANKQLYTYGITKNNELIASCIFISSHNRYYYILVGNTPSSRSIGASHALIDSFIQDHAGENKFLDFEGSDIPGLAKFYSSFGAKEENYAAIRLNKLPFYLRWLKK